MFADVQKSVGYVIAAILIVGFAVAVIINMRQGKREVGSEIELAPNRKPYYGDEDLETTRLNRTLLAGLALLAVTGLTLPLYWLYEPARQEGAVEQYQETFISRGEALYVEGAQCASCHGPEGVGGVASTTLTAPNGDFVAQVEWQAPALNTVLYRYSREEVLYILQYGRGFSPMPAWGALGGGPLTDQQLENIVDYLQAIQLPVDEVRAEVDKELEETCRPDAAGLCTLPGSRFETMGQALFDMGLYTKFAAGAYSCGRCHTPGWSHGQPGPSGGGAFGPNITGGSELRQFPTAEQQVDFVSEGGVIGRPYGTSGQSSHGMMPGFGLNPNTDPPQVTGPPVTPMSPEQTMFTPEQVEAVVAYERSL